MTPEGAAMGEGLRRWAKALTAWLQVQPPPCGSCGRELAFRPRPLLDGYTLICVNPRCERFGW